MEGVAEKFKRALTSMAQLVGVSSHKPKGHRFDSQSGHMPRLWVRSLVGACVRGNQLMFLSHINGSLPLSLPSLLSKKSISMSSGKDLKKGQKGQTPKTPGKMHFIKAVRSDL